MTNDYGLLFYISEDFTEANVDSLKEAIAGLVEGNEWIGGPPEFIDDTEPAESERDEAVRTVGGFFRFPPPDAVSGRLAENSYFHEVERIVHSLSAFSAGTRCEFELELGGAFTGTIVNGEPDELVTVGLLEEWRKALR